MNFNNEYIWLDHIKTSIPKEAYGYPVSMYSVALEGWRRGLTLKFINNGFKVRAVTEFELSGFGESVKFKGVRPELVSREAILTCIYKERTKEQFLKANVKTPQGKMFNREDNEKIVKYATELGFPLVLKPTNASGGRGVIANIKDEPSFKEALIYVRETLGYRNVIVEKYIKGKDYRVFAIGNKVIAAFRRIPANVTGDGKRTIKELFQSKRKLRTKNPGIHKHNIRFDKETMNLLKEQGYTEKDVPKKGEVVYLKTTSNVSSGGDSIDATEELPITVKNEIVKALNSVPNLKQAGIDVIYDKKTDDFAIIEMNTQPSLRGHLFPMKGQARDVPRAIIDHYFPETKDIRVDNKPYYYFDIETVFSSFRDNIAKEITVPKIPSDNTLVKEYQIEFVRLRKRNANWFQREGRLLGIYGHIKILDNKLKIRCLGNKEALHNYSTLINNNAIKRYNITSIKEIELEKEECSPYKISFEIKNLSQARKNNSNKSESKQKRLERKADKRSEVDYKKKYNEILNSTSWKITKPLRVLGLIKKRFKNKKK